MKPLILSPSRITDLKPNRIFITCLCFIMLILTSTAFSEAPVLVERQGIYYPVNSQKPYTGKQTLFHHNKQIKRISNFKNGVPEGAYINYHPNGQLEQEGNQINGKLEGDYFWYFINGQLKQKSLFKNGLLHGMTSYYRKNGTLETKKEYLAGQLNGKIEWYDENGKLRGVWENARMSIFDFPIPWWGQTVYYTPSGEVYERKYWLDGVEIDYDPGDEFR
ncbi:toxin-antitoxin system YwqK family antitoxin [Porticoccaceae bacterium]|nr:toxin-antitoxin system YwqK family antitoxin [Porticoccaceae bacterium]